MWDLSSLRTGLSLEADRDMENDIIYSRRLGAITKYGPLNFSFLVSRLHNSRHPSTLALFLLVVETVNSYPFCSLVVGPSALMFFGLMSSSQRKCLRQLQLWRLDNFWKWSSDCLTLVHFFHKSINSLAFNSSGKHN